MDEWQAFRTLETIDFISGNIFIIFSQPKPYMEPMCNRPSLL